MEPGTPVATRGERAPELERRRRAAGLTLIELIVTLGVVGLLAALSAEIYSGALHRARTTRAVADLRTLEKQIFDHSQDFGSWPDSLHDIERGDLNDPWGNPYRYENLEVAGSGAARKDRFNVPLNTQFDLYSPGPDGSSELALTAATSRDDIVRAGDGAFVGAVGEF